MPTGPDPRAELPPTAAETPRIDLPALSDPRQPPGAAQAERPSPARDRAGEAATPAKPAARFHWVGTLGTLRHPADLYPDVMLGTPGVIVVDARYPEAYAREHLPGAINLPHVGLDEATTADLPCDALYVVYCWNTSCHASTRTARRLQALGFRATELHGGLEAWRRQGYPTERG
ncbi:MAG: rhodanese-like domain-containing protein [Candidatus Limnocylindrales bacterium]|jgi:rhodanese-related sulfurtransferase